MMPFRITGRWAETRTKIQFTTSASMPRLIYRACLATGVVSNTVYCQRALVAALARDLGLDEVQLLNDLPEPRGPAAHLYDPDEHTMRRYPITEGQSGGAQRIGPANTTEEVR
jgi:hypothetical protein